MSTGLNCNFVEVTGGPHTEWFYLLEQGSAPKNAWDWREYADAYGPFEGEEAARKHLRDNHANPGGSNTVRITKAELAKDEVLAQALAEAPTNTDRLKSTRVPNPFYRPIRSSF